METKNKIENLFNTKMKNFSDEELNVLFNHSYDVIVYTECIYKEFRYITINEDLIFQIDENLTLLYYFKKVKVYYFNEIEIKIKRDIIFQAKKLLNI